MSSSVVHAQIYKCQTQYGSIEYNSLPCSAVGGQKVLSEASAAVTFMPATTQKIEKNNTSISSEDKSLIDNCVAVQLKVRAIQKEISQRKVRQSSGGKHFGSTSVQEDEFAIKRLDLEIGEHERLGRVAGCGRVGASINSAATRAKALDIVCGDVRNQITFFTSGNGHTDPRATELVLDLKKELRTNGC
jgi:hypothetical protein